MFRFNMLGLVFALIAAIVGNVIGRLAAAGNVTVIGTIAGIVLILLDGVYRWRKPNLSHRERWLGPRAGGHFIFLPMWSVGIIMIVISFIEQKS